MDAIEDLLTLGLNSSLVDIPSSVVERVRLGVLDILGTSIAGVCAEGVEAITALVTEWGGRPEATIITTGGRIPAHVAGMVNGVAARAWDMDDVHEQNTCHVFASLVPAALALAEARGPVNGKELLTAIAIGAEVICRLSSAPRISFSETGSSMTYQCGFYGVSLMASRLLGLSRDQARHALGIAHARVAGNQQGFLAGAMTIKLMQGIAVEGGLQSALMAERGITGSAEILEGRFGYFPVYHRGRYDRAALVDELGQKWLVPEISIKPASPCCKYVHGPIEATILCMQELAIGVTEIEAISVKVTNREVYDLVCLPRERKWNPQTLADAQFSLAFTVAHAAIHKTVNFNAFQPTGLADVEVKELMPRIAAELDVSAQGEGRGTFPMPGIVTVTSKDGRRASHTVHYVKGHPNNPMSFDEVAEKFRVCAALGRQEWLGAQSVIDKVRELEQMKDVGELTQMCAA